MRSLLPATCLLLLVAIAGCASTRFGPLKTGGTPAGPVEEISTAKLVDYLNQNAANARSLRVDDLEITAHQGLLQSISLRGKMVAEQPRNFRMKGEVMGSQVVDLGSNQQEFWWWLRESPQPYQFYCAYKDFEDGRVRQLPFPFQPEWIMETMGLGPYSPAENYQRQDDAEFIRLVEKTRSPQGKMVRKVIVMKRRPQKGNEPQVTDFQLIDDSTGQEVCSAHVTEVQLNAGFVVPRRVELRWPTEKLRLALKLDGVTVNQPLPAGSTVFTRTPLTGVQSFDLARMQVDGLQRTGGQ